MMPISYFMNELRRNYFKVILFGIFFVFVNLVSMATMIGGEGVEGM